MMKLVSVIFIPLTLLCMSCSDQEQIITVVETKQKPKIEVITSIAEPEQISLYETIDISTKVFFKYKPQFASMVGITNADVGFYYQNQLDSYDIETTKQFKQDLAKTANALTNLASNHEDVDEDNRRVMANLFGYFAGSPKHDIGFIDSYFGHQPFIISQINGPLIDTLFTFTNGETINSIASANDYINRLEGFAEQIKEVEQVFIKDSQQGWIPPAAIIKSSIEYLTGYTDVAVKNNTLLTHFSDSLDKAPQINAADKKQFISKAQTILANKIYPAFIQVTNTVKGVQSKAPTSDGIWAQPGGEEFYQYTIKTQGNSDLTADEIHQLGLKEVSRISADMDSILQQFNYTQGSVAQRLIALAKEPRFSYSDTEQDREQVIIDLTAQIDAINKIMPTQFKTPISYNVEVKAFPREVEEGNSGGQYTNPSLDGSKPGIFWINLRDIENLAKFDLPTLTFHETNPGHHWQVSLNMAQTKLPLLRKFAAYNAYVEGWALYAEQVAYEMGMYAQDPYSNLGRLKAEIFRAVRLVVDTGLHHKKWTREQAIAYMIEHTGAPHSEAKAEIERYMVWPGQALGYKLGMLKILELRAQAEKLLGERFDISEFHDVVLLNGALPLSILEQKVNDWIAEQ
ncbi:DUF885 domain-containing protein [Thalassotalea nanhaiensis]|uniref:DUF885 domain-containing protein n=1 Tax=Thalassotalea nanhaiensis TaxID=3065648 RepID=A0ABY9TM63_9GAMM|nr:DUF885 domain-containing protein [Colwelliaceae bacterium SQ345]